MHLPRLFSSRKDWAVAVFVVFVFFVGGASRDDVTSLLLLRPVSACAVVWFAFQLSRNQWRDIRTPLALLGAAIVLVVIQLIPLPPSIWHQLPGREILMSVDKLTGLGEPWRPLSMSPPETRNALISLIIPLAMLLGAASLDERGRRNLLTVLIAVIALSVFVSVLQLGGGANSLFYFYSITNKGMMVGLFSNRNHNAVVIACLLPMLAVKLREWMQTRGESRAPKLLIGFSAALAVLPILAVVGSRMGFVAGVVGVLCAAYILVRGNSMMREVLFKYRVAVGVSVAVAASLIFVLITRYGSVVQRTTSMDSSEIRFNIWRASWDLVGTYFPVGSGFGSFVSVYRAHEPIVTIEPSYINHVHGDFIEILIDGGIVAGALFLLCLIVFLARLAKLLVSKGGSNVTFGLLGASIIMILWVGSITDYPLRVPSVMALFAIASLWFFDSRSGLSQRVPTVN